jgi:hypothetical protein
VEAACLVGITQNQAQKTHLLLAGPSVMTKHLKFLYDDQPVNKDKAKIIHNLY